MLRSILITTLSTAFLLGGCSSGDNQSEKSTSPASGGAQTGKQTGSQQSPTVQSTPEPVATPAAVPTPASTPTVAATPTIAASPTATATPSVAATPVTVSIAQGSMGKGAAAFGVNPLVIPAGTTVTWVNNDSMPHTATSNTGVFDSGTLQPGQSFSFKFMTPGTYPYICSIHGQASMSGSIQVQ